MLLLRAHIVKARVHNHDSLRAAAADPVQILHLPVVVPCRNHNRFCTSVIFRNVCGGGCKVFVSLAYLLRRHIRESLYQFRTLGTVVLVKGHLSPIAVAVIDHPGKHAVPLCDMPNSRRINTDLCKLPQPCLGVIRPGPGNHADLSRLPQPHPHGAVGSVSAELAQTFFPVGIQDIVNGDAADRYIVHFFASARAIRSRSSESRYPSSWAGIAHRKFCRHSSVRGTVT